MIKLTFFVKATGWIGDGYVNVHYFRTSHDMKSWLKKPWNACCSIISVENVSMKDAADDII